MRGRTRSSLQGTLRAGCSAAVLSLAACGGTGEPSRTGGAEDRELRGSMLPAPMQKSDFTLNDTEGRPFHFRERTDGYLTLLFFGYTNCPDVCPVHMANLGQVLRRFPHDVRSRIKVVFVTTDPARDSPQRLREWLDRFDPSFIGLTGSSDEVDGIQREFGLAAAVREEPDTEGSYLVGHSARLLAFTPDNLSHVTYPFGTRQIDLAHDLPRLLDRYPPTE